jgi:hypothetical protein
MQIPLIGCTIDGMEYTSFLDTGAKLSYLPSSSVADRKSVGQQTDFYPGEGTFTTECYDLPTQFGSETITIRYGVLPPNVLFALGIGGAQGIIGYDFFKEFSVLLRKGYREMYIARNS